MASGFTYIAVPTLSISATTVAFGNVEVNTASTQTVTLDVQFEPTATGAATGQLTIQSNSSTNGTVMINLGGTGTSPEVDLSWDAPSSSPDPMAGYNIYRSIGGSSTYQLLNSSIDTETTYVDSTVQSGTAYTYYVESVDSSGVKSAPSNQVNVTIP